MLFVNRQIFQILGKFREPSTNSYEISVLDFKTLRKIKESQFVSNRTRQSNNVNITLFFRSEMPKNINICTYLEI